MLDRLFEAIFGIRDGTSWLDLDDRMKGQLRFWGAMSVIALLVLIVSSLYFYVQWVPVKAWIDSVLSDVQQSVKTKGEIPSWVVWVGGVWLMFLMPLSLLFFYFLVDLGKMHYKIDSVTFRAIPTVQKYIKFALIQNPGCPNSNDCALRTLAASRSGSRRLMTDVFYFFTNQDQVGAFNQKDKRRQVFAYWTKYYVFNYIMVIASLAWLWFSFLMLVRTSIWISVALLAIAVPLVVFWHWQGIQYRKGVIELAADQIRAFHQHARKQVNEQLHKTVGSCSSSGCPFGRIIEIER